MSNIFFKVFGLYIAVNPFGNCFSPALIFTHDYSRSITFRDRSHHETTIYYRKGKFWWNSEHIAQRFGEEHYGVPPAPNVYWTYEGWLGNHHSV